MSVTDITELYNYHKQRQGIGAVNDIFLQIESYSFGIAKIFHAFGYCDASFFANTEEAVDGSPTGKDNGRMVEDLDPLAAELFERHPFDFDEGMELCMNMVFGNQLVVG